ncbi:MAG: hypothetical protein OSB18_13185 [SAR324 cluster bacterium]|nr:hypothetical protein [SAR324 cluster bacterium]
MVVGGVADHQCMTVCGGKGLNALDTALVGQHRDSEQQEQPAKGAVSQGSSSLASVGWSG